MTVGRIILYALLIWFLYNLIFKFIVPVYRTTRKVKKQFRDMREKVDEQMRQQQGFTPKTGQTPKKPSSPKPAGDYIDFEEIK